MKLLNIANVFFMAKYLKKPCRLTGLGDVCCYLPVKKGLMGGSLAKL